MLKLRVKLLPVAGFLARLGSEKLLLHQVPADFKKASKCCLHFCSCFLVPICTPIAVAKIVVRFLHPQGVSISRVSGDSSTDGLIGFVHLTDTPRSRSSSPNLVTSTRFSSP